MDRRDGKDIEHIGTYIEIVRPTRIVFDFAVPQYSDEKPRVQVEIAPHGSASDGTLTHRGVYSEYEEKTRRSWTTILNALADSLDFGRRTSTHDPRRSHLALQRRPVEQHRENRRRRRHPEVMPVAAAVECSRPCWWRPSRTTA